MAFGYAGCPYPNLSEICAPSCGPCGGGAGGGSGYGPMVPYGGGGSTVFPGMGAPMAVAPGPVGQAFPNGGMDPRCFLCPPWSRNTICRDEIVSIDSGTQVPTTVPAGGSATYVATASSPFQPYCLVVPSHIAQFFIIDDIVIGNERVLNNAQGVSATIFSEVATCRVCQWPVLYPGLQLSLRVRNVDDEAPVQAHPFQASLLGKTIEC